MPFLSDLSLHPAVVEQLQPLVRDKQVASRAEVVWVQKGRIRMEFEDGGEGYEGDYNEDDPDDKPLLRFSFFVNNPSDPDHWIYLDECSYCTGLPATAPWEIQLAEACKTFDEVYEYLRVDHDDELDETHGRLGSRVCERASWLNGSGWDELRAAMDAAQLDNQSPQVQSSSSRPRI